EAPSPFLDEATRRAMGEQSCALAKAVGYRSAGTVEFIVDGERNFYFLEMNTRLQVEHPVTELITGVDLVEQMIRVAAGEPLSLTQDAITLTGWAMESRIYAEDPYRNFLPSIGRLTRYRPPAEMRSETEIVRNDTGVEEGGEISRFYDPMIAKLCTWAPDRAAAIAAQRRALDAFELEGIGHNIPFLQAVYDHERFTSGAITTAFIAEEYPDGFHGASLPEDTIARIAKICAFMQYVRDYRALQISGRMREPLDDIDTGYLVEVSGKEFEFKAFFEPDEYFRFDRKPSTVEFLSALHDGTQALDLHLAWKPGASLAVVHGEPHREGDETATAYLEWDGPVDMILKVEERTEGFRIRYRGADLEVTVREPRVAELAKLMPVKVPPDTSKWLLCPMPGVVVSIAVEAGQEVQAGQALATVEAMKMENVLRAEKKATVKEIKAAPGQSLAVDEIILEFE
ncbi:MAG: biotin/lipoyl-containing protein, partial [Pseudomonadota bacterium]